MFTPRPSILTASLFVLTSLASADTQPRSEEQILKSVKVPDGYKATVFAKAPELGYPTTCSAAVDGTLFVGIDENGSLGAKPNRGRVVRLRDTNGDGKADESILFATMDSPRGVIWDGPTGAAPGRLYVMHPPKLTAFTDTDGDGKSDKQEDILTGLGFDLTFRGADHATNGCRLGIDGFIYIAVGDYGFTEATAMDGTKLSMRGGGIVRVRPDGTGFEIVSRGQRNIYDVAVSPTLDLFTRDNTNDGRGWDVRLSHVPVGTQMGYPTLFQNFREDMLQPLAVLGSGSPCGALWLDEPGMQNGLYTVEWGRNAIMYHPLTANGSSWKAEEQSWLELARPTDMDVDASGRLYVTSWEGATFDYDGPFAGYILRLTKDDAKPAQPIDLRKIADLQLVQSISSLSATIRGAVQREILRRGVKPGVADTLYKIASTKGEAGPRVAALETLVQLLGAQAIPSLTELAQDETIREHAVRALGSDERFAGKVPSQALVAALADPNPRVRVAAITSLRRLRKTDATQSILPLVVDEDPIISHLAVRALSSLKAVQVCLSALDSSDENVKPGAMRALYAIYDTAVIDGLIARLPSTKGEFRRNILNALCRLANQDTPYTNPKVWWGTHPDTSGPVYQPLRWAESDKIEGVLKKELDAAADEDAFWLVQRLMLTKVTLPGLDTGFSSKMLAKGKEAAAKLAAVEALMKTKPVLFDEVITVLQGIVADDKQMPELRARALRQFQRCADGEKAILASLAALAVFIPNDPHQAVITAAVEDFTHDSKLAGQVDHLVKAAKGTDEGKRTAAQTILVNLATSTLVTGDEEEEVEAAVAKGWEQPETAASLLGVIARTKAKAYSEQVRAHLKAPNNTVAEAALFAYQSLGLTDTAATVPMIGQMKYEEVATAARKGGDVAAGKDIYLRASCSACHTTSYDEPAKGPMLAAVAKMYDRTTLIESILKPNAKLAQGFESSWIKTKKGEEIEGFVTREGGDSVDIRNIVGQTVTVEIGEIAERGHRPQSMMPDGLMNSFTPAEFANLLAYIESLKGK